MWASVPIAGVFYKRRCKLPAITVYCVQDGLMDNGIGVKVEELYSVDILVVQ